MRPSSSPRPAEPALELSGARVRFGAREALAGVSLRVEQGERVAIVGASGAGKSTLLGLLVRSVLLSAGTAAVGGRDLAALDARELHAVRRRIGFVHQAHGLVPQLSAGLNVAVGELSGRSRRALIGALLRGPDRDLSARSVTALAAVGLGDRAPEAVRRLSGGEQQRVAVARVLLQRPALVLADEPVASVDRESAEVVLSALMALAADGTTLLVSLHDVGLARRFDRVLGLRAGRLAFDGPPAELSDAVLRELYAREGGEGLAPDDARGAGAEPEAARDVEDAVLASDREGYGLRAR